MAFEQDRTPPNERLIIQTMNDIEVILDNGNYVRIEKVFRYQDAHGKTKFDQITLFACGLIYLEGEGFQLLVVNSDDDSTYTMIDLIPFIITSDALTITDTKVEIHPAHTHPSTTSR